MELADRRRAVMSVLDDAAKTAGIPRDLLGGIWSIESTCGQGLSSGTGSEGDFQFLASTFAGEIKQNGSKIADRLSATGHADLAAKVKDYQRGLKDGTISESDAGLQNLRYDPYVSTYAGAMLAAENAHTAHVDPYNKAEWGVIYAGYNVGPTKAGKLRHEYYNTPGAGQYLGKAARVNPAFFRNNATGAEALACYQARIAEHANQFVKQFEHGVPSTNYATSSTRTAPASSSSTSTTTTTPAYSSTNTRTSSGTQPDYFEDVVGKYLGDGQVHQYKDTIVKYGICQSANPDVDVAHLTRDQALQIYRDRYWNNLTGIHDMSRDEAAAAFRMSYRHGATYANSHLDATGTKTESTAPQSMRMAFQTSSAPPQVESLATKFFRSAATELRNFFTLSPSTPAFSFT